ncbi:MAG: hypothetical protein ACHQ7N_08945 [Candidatus Methylomirabilales bacterium]
MAELLSNRVPSLGLSLGFIPAVGYVDYRTASELDLFLFYALPVGIAAWGVGRLPAVLAGFLSVAFGSGPTCF